ncbi:MAG: copper chaperone PCu(A)C [Pseudomonadales bacterium]|nr:copper chaperone PCu(A)C [Pseudomonadales bacterium]
MASDIQIEQASVRETLPGLQISAAYMVIKNNSEKDLRLVNINSPRIPNIEMHENRHQGEMMAMRKVESLVIPAGGEFGFRPGGHHLMLMGLKQPLIKGEEVTLRLVFEGGKEVEVLAPVISLNHPMGEHPMSH